MSITLDMIQRRSKFIRVGVLSTTAIVLIFLAYELVFNHRVGYYDNALFDELWQSDKVNNVGLFLATTPILFLALAGVHFITRLLKYFEQGHFFTRECLSCFIYFIITEVLSIFFVSALSVIFAYWHDAYFEHTTLVLSLQFGELVTLSILATVAYLLRAAQEISDENKEFI
ncbi:MULTISPECIES: hypothetical protein [Pseudoalteromonas]|uniref:hypothetical protein n=1 Tax=Pseudoalteromonas TaxID=53246 RepID=UPI000FFE89D1|nr:hypothetical protein [Pseudoalteromonas sp. A757]RXE87890.1 hypothetical protein DRB05_05520 [Pseudoalteromonas sp. A757]